MGSGPVGGQVRSGAEVAARAGNLKPYQPIPYFWTDQYDVKIQAYGTLTAETEPTIAAGDIGSGRFAAVYLRAGRIAGVLGWNLPRETRQLRARIGQRASSE